MSVNSVSRNQYPLRESRCSSIFKGIKTVAKVVFLGAALFAVAPKLASAETALVSATTPPQSSLRPFLPLQEKCRIEEVCELGKDGEIRCSDEERQTALESGKKLISSFHYRPEREQVEKDGPVSYRFGTRKECPNGHSWDVLPETREVVITDEIPTYMIDDVMVFGLEKFYWMSRTTPKKVDLTVSNVECPAVQWKSAIEKTRQKLLACPSAKALLKEVAEKGTFTFRCGATAETNGAGKSLLDKREILIGTPDEEEIPAVMVHELGNLNNKEGFKQVFKTHCHNEPDHFAAAVEFEEYRVLKKTHQVLEECIENGAFASNANPYREVFQGKSKNGDFRTFDGFLKTQMKTGHTQYYARNQDGFCWDYRRSH